MLIDPFTIVAQIINFVILAAALKYFLYDRVIDAMDKRQASIASQLTDATERETQARSEAEEYAKRRAALDSERHQLMDEARSEARRHRQHLLDQARADAGQERKRWRHGLRSEQRELSHELQTRAANEVMELSRRALSDLAGADLEDHVISRALEQLKNDSDARTALFGSSPQSTTVAVRTAFALTGEQRSEVRRQLLELGLSPDQAVGFELDPDLVVGVELRVDGTAVSWNATDYFDRMQMSLDELLADVDPA